MTLLGRLLPSPFDPKQKYTTDRYQKGAYTDPHKNPGYLVARVATH